MKYTFIVEYPDNQVPDGFVLGTEILGGRLRRVAFKDINDDLLSEEEASAVLQLIDHAEAFYFTDLCDEYGADRDTLLQKLYRSC